MGKRPTGSGGEPSSPNRETSAGVRLVTLFIQRCELFGCAAFFLVALPLSATVATDCSLGLCAGLWRVQLPHIAGRSGKALAKGPIEPREVVEPRVVRNGADGAPGIPWVGELLKSALYAQLQQIVAEGGAFALEQ